MTLGPGIPETTHDLDLAVLFDAYPQLRRHRCESGHHRSFETEARQTETVHLLEHLAVELLAQSGVPRDRAHGTTGIPRDKSSPYKLRFHGAASLEQMDALLQKAAQILQNLAT